MIMAQAVPQVMVHLLPTVIIGGGLMPTPLVLEGNENVWRPSRTHAVENIAPLLWPRDFCPRS